MNRDKFLLNASDQSPERLQDFQFLGKLVGLAVRHDILVPLNLPSLVWRPLVGLRVDRRDLGAVDQVVTNAIRMVESWREDEFELGVEASLDGLGKAFQKIEVDKVDDWNSGGGLGGGGGGGGIPRREPLTFANRLEFVRQVETGRLKQMDAPLSAFLTGLSAVLPAPLLPLFKPEELEELICGSPEIDIELLKRVTDYEGEGVSADAEHVKFFWASLEQMDQGQRSRFINFVSARSRLPGSADDFHMNFKIIEAKPKAKEDPDAHLPQSQTCFFSLNLPQYSSQEVCFRRLLYAVENATTMDDDYTNRDTWG
jgi:hypothetical protein